MLDLGLSRPELHSSILLAYVASKAGNSDPIRAMSHTAGHSSTTT